MRSVVVARGASAREKLVHIEGIDEEELSGGWRRAGADRAPNPREAGICTDTADHGHASKASLHPRVTRRIRLAQQT
jgi:hypothetical protein